VKTPQGQEKRTKKEAPGKNEGGEKIKDAAEFRRFINSQKPEE
jgi:hypothetical protein